MALGSTGVERMLTFRNLDPERTLTFSNLDRQGSSERSSGPGGQVKSGKSGRLGRQGTKQVNETRHSWHELCGAERSEAPCSTSRGGLFHFREIK